jgi:hypothetical protein
VLNEGFAILVRSHSCVYSLFIGGFLAGVIAVKSEGLLLFSLRVFHPWKNCPTVLFDRDQTLRGLIYEPNLSLSILIVAYILHM